MHIRLVLVPSENAAELTMEIEDQAGEITIDPDHPGRGLLNIHDRADAIGAEYTFDPLNGTPRHRVHLWVAMPGARSEEHTSELQSLMRISYAVFCLKKKNPHIELRDDKILNN